MGVGLGAGLKWVGSALGGWPWGVMGAIGMNGGGEGRGFRGGGVASLWAGLSMNVNECST